METTAWWGNSYSLHSFIMECARRAEKGRRFFIGGTLEDKDVFASLRADSIDSSNGSVSRISFALYSDEGFRENIEETAAEGIRLFGGEGLCMDATYDDGIERFKMTRSICPAKLNIFGFPRVYRVKSTNLITGEERIVVEESNLGLFTPEIAAEMFADAIRKSMDAALYSECGSNSHILFCGNRAEGRKHRVSVLSRGGLSCRLGEGAVNRVGDFIVKTGYQFKGKEWNINLYYKD